MLSPLRLTIAASAILWIIGTAAMALYPPAAPVAAGALTASILVAVGAALIQGRRLTVRLAALETRVSALRSGLTKERPLPSSEDDWTPRPGADAREVAAILAVAGQVDIGALMRVGAADHPALADTIAAIDRTSPDRVVVVGAPAEALALSVVSARGSRRTVTALLADAASAEILQQEAAGPAAAVLDVVVLPYDKSGGGGGWSTDALAALPFAGLVYLGGPSWNLGSEVRHSLVDRVIAALAVTAVIVPDPRRFESQAVIGRLRTGGFELSRETASTAHLERVPSPT